MAHGVEITQDARKVYVVAAFNHRFVRDARTNGGKWDAARRAWAFPKERLAFVQELCRLIHGTDGTVVPTLCTIRVKLGGDSGLDQDVEPLILGGWQLLTRRGRDRAVSFGEGVVLAEGPDFPASCGSVQNPRISRDGAARELLFYGVSVELAKSIVRCYPGSVTIEADEEVPSPKVLDATAQARARVEEILVHMEALEGELQTLRAFLAAAEPKVA